jgi:hypothetical protein
LRWCVWLAALEETADAGPFSEPASEGPTPSPTNRTVLPRKSKKPVSRPTLRGLKTTECQSSTRVIEDPVAFDDQGVSGGGE